MPLLSDRVCEANRTKLVLELTVAALSVTTVLLAGALLFRNPPVQTVVLPPSVVKDSGWTFTESGPSAAYLERWSTDLLSLAANLTPETADASMQRLLAHVNPEDVVRLRILLENQIEGLKAEGAIVTDCVAITSFGIDETKKLFEREQVTCHEIVRFEKVLDKAIELGKLEADKKDSLVDWLNNPWTWAARHQLVPNANEN